MTIQTLPLSCLTMSKMNVRRTERDADVAALAEDIASCGLKQNLVVVPAHFSTAEIEKDFGDKFEVIAGGRRYQALRLLADTGRIAFDFPVPVLVEAREAAAATSLSENLHRVAMNPADEFDAFAAIVRGFQRDGMMPDDAVTACAKRFGVTVKHVQGRLRLANLAPEVLEALRTDKITLDIAKAYAGTTDQALQLQVFKAVSKVPYPISAKDVRQRLRGVTCSLDDHRVEFIGLDAYRAAGGRTEAEMFMGTDGEERVLDVPLLERLAEAKGAEMAEAAAKADGWKSGLFTLGSAYTVKKPDGFSLFYHGADQVAKTRRKKCIAVYTNQGSAVTLEAYFEPSKPAEPSIPRDWQAEREAAQREKAIYRRAARLAIGPLSAGPFAGTVLEGRLFWPTHHLAPVEILYDDNGRPTDTVMVGLQISVPAADIEALLDEATRQHDEELAAAAAAVEVEDIDA